MVQLGDLYYCEIMDDSGEYFIAMVTKITKSQITLTCTASKAKHWRVGETTTRDYYSIGLLGKKIA